MGTFLLSLEVFLERWMYASMFAGLLSFVWTGAFSNPDWKSCFMVLACAVGLRVSFLAAYSLLRLAEEASKF